MNGYDLSRTWFDFAFDHKECKVQHTALYLWIVELNNRLGWKKEFGLPTVDTMEGLSIGNRGTFLATLEDLVKWGFVKIVQESKNQNQSRIISLCHSKSEQAEATTLDKALIQHVERRRNGTSNGTDTGTVPIDKPLNNETIKPLNKKFTPPSLNEVIDFFKEKNFPEQLARKAFEYYEAGNWKDGGGKQVKNWKQKMIAVWQKEENKNYNGKINTGSTGQLAPLRVEKKPFGSLKLIPSNGTGNS